MYIDIAVAVILILCIFTGDRKGFLRSFISTFGWMISVTAAWLFRTPVTEYLDANTSVRSDIQVKITEYIAYRIRMSTSGADSGEIQGGIASALRSAADNALQAAAAKSAEPITDAIMGILVILMILLAVRVVMFIIERFIGIFLQKGKPLGSIDSILGMIFALMKGCIISGILILLIYLVAVVGNINALLDQIGTSYLCQMMLNAELVPNIFANFIE